MVIFVAMSSDKSIDCRRDDTGISRIAVPFSTASSAMLMAL